MQCGAQRANSTRQIILAVQLAYTKLQFVRFFRGIYCGRQGVRMTNKQYNVALLILRSFSPRLQSHQRDLHFWHLDGIASLGLENYESKMVANPLGAVSMVQRSQALVNCVFVDTLARSMGCLVFHRVGVREFSLRRSTCGTPFASCRCAIGCHGHTKVATTGSLMSILREFSSHYRGQVILLCHDSQRAHTSSIRIFRRSYIQDR